MSDSKNSGLIAEDHGLAKEAMRMAAFGYKVFPCHWISGDDKCSCGNLDCPSPGKHPLTEHGCNDATTDEDLIAKWWEQYPNANVAVATTGLLVIDTDPLLDGSKNPWADNVAGGTGLGAGALAQTPRGGNHYWFRQPKGANYRNTTSKLAPKVDTRANGGYALVYPSRTDKGQYKWIEEHRLNDRPESLPEPPEWLCHLLVGGQETGLRNSPSDDDSTGQIIEGNRNNTLFSQAGYLRRAGFDKSVILNHIRFVNVTRCSPPLDDDEVKKLAWSICRYRPDQVTAIIVNGVPQIEFSGMASPVDADEKLTYQQFPIEALPEPVRTYVEAAARAVPCDPCMVAVPLLTTIGGAIGTTRVTRVKLGWTEPPVLWTAVVSESGTAKSVAHDKGTRFIEWLQKRYYKQWEKEMKEYEMAMKVFKIEEKEALKTEVPPPEEPPKPVLKSLFTMDATIEALGMLLYVNSRGMVLTLDELAAFFRSMNAYRSGGRGADREHYLSMFGARPMRIDRRYAGCIYIPRAFLGICGCITPGGLRRAFEADGNAENGLAARFLIFAPPRRPKTWTNFTVPDAVIDTMSKLFETLFELVQDSDEDGDAVPYQIPFTERAQEIFIEWHDRHNMETLSFDGSLAASYSKLEAYVSRIALILAIAEHPNLYSIPVHAVESAIRIVEWFKYEARRWHQGAAVLKAEDDRVRAVEWIRRKGGSVTSRELQQNGPRPRPTDSEQADRLLQDLAERGFGEWRELPTTEVGGRPTREFVLTCPEGQRIEANGDSSNPIFDTPRQQDRTRNEPEDSTKWRHNPEKRGNLEVAYPGQPGYLPPPMPQFDAPLPNDTSFESQQGAETP